MISSSRVRASSSTAAAAAGGGCGGAVRVVVGARRDMDGVGLEG